MLYAIVNSDGELYAGFEDGKPQWRRAKRDEYLMAEDLADTVLRQLHHLGFENTAKRDANNITRKWVPKSMSAV
mgnify:CR=1 FL=1